MEDKGLRGGAGSDFSSCVLEGSSLDPFVSQRMEETDTLSEWSHAGVDEGLESADIQLIEIDIKALLCQMVEKMETFEKLLEKHAPSFEDTIAALRLIADDVDHFHRGATIASITGGAVSAAGGITTIVGLALAPFTFGASLIVTGVGLGVAAAGGVTSATATISDTVNERVECNKVEGLINTYKENMSELEALLKSIHCQLDRLTNHPEFTSISIQEVQNLVTATLTRAGRGILNVVEIVRLAQLGKAAGGLAQGIRIAGMATGILTGLFLFLDAVFITKDAVDLHKGAKTKAAEKIREAADELEKGLNELLDVGCSVKKAWI